MAIWQYDLEVVPRKAVATPGVVAAVINIETLDAYGSGEWPSLDALANALDTLMPRRVHWSPKAIGWGIEDGTCAEVWHEGATIAFVGLRLDARAPDMGFIARLAALLVELDLATVDHAGHVVPAKPQRLMHALMHSTAAHFVADPAAFIEGAARELEPSDMPRVEE